MSDDLPNPCDLSMHERHFLYGGGDPRRKPVGISNAFVELHRAARGLGDCYKAAGQMIYMHPGGRLVHGMVTGQGAIEGLRYGHAWVEANGMALDHSNGRRIEMPVDAYYALGKIKPNECRYYTMAEAMAKMDELMHWGPWE